MSSGNPVPFNFAAACERMRVRYPAETANLTQADISSVEGQWKAWDWMQAVSDDSLALMGAAHLPPSVARHFIFEDFLGRSAVTVLDPATGKKLLMMHTSGVPGPPLGGGPQEQLRFACAHEHGHPITSGGMTQRSLAAMKTAAPVSAAKVINREIFAETFGVADGLSEAFMTWERVQRLSLGRALEMWLGKGLFHTTTLALDRFALDHADTGFPSLSAGEIKALSEAHAEKYPAMERDMTVLSVLRPTRVTGVRKDDRGPFLEFGDGGGILILGGGGAVMTGAGSAPEAEEERYQRRVDTAIELGRETQADRQQWLRDLVNAAKRASANSLAFYAPAKIAAHILNTGEVDHPLPRKFDVKGLFCWKARRMLRARAREMGMSKILAVGPGPL